MNKLLFILLFFAFAAYGQQQKRIAIVNSEDDGEPPIKNSELTHLTDKLREIANKTLPKKDYAVMTLQSIVAFLGSQENMVKECKAAEGCLAKLGRKINADYVGQARIGRFGKDLTIKVEVYESGSGDLISSFTGNSKNIYGLLSLLEKEAPGLFKEMPGVAGGSSTASFSIDGIKAYLLKGDYDRAIEECSAALRIKPDLFEALNGRGFAYLLKGNYDRAIEDYNAALRIKPDYYKALSNRGRAYADKGNYDKAIEDYTALLRIKPDDQDALGSRGFAYSKKGNYDRAIEDYTALLRIKPDDPVVLYIRGRVYATKGNSDRAIEDYTAALRIKPDFKALYWRGREYATKGNYDRAIEDYTAALRIELARIEPSYQDALHARGIAYSKKGNYDRAIEDYTAVLKIKPDYYKALYNRGNAYSNKGNYDRAIEDYNAALRIKPDLHEALYNRGIAYSDKGNHDLAIEDFNAVLRIDPNNVKAQEALKVISSTPKPSASVPQSNTTKQKSRCLLAKFHFQQRIGCERYDSSIINKGMQDGCFGDMVLNHYRQWKMTTNCNYKANDVAD